MLAKAAKVLVTIVRPEDSTESRFRGEYSRPMRAFKTDSIRYQVCLVCTAAIGLFQGDKYADFHIFVRQPEAHLHAHTVDWNRPIKDLE